MKHFKFILYYISISLFFSITCIATEEFTLNQNIYDNIKLATNELDLHLHKECHVNIFNLVKKLKTRLADQDFDKIQVIVMLPLNKMNTYAETYLPNTNWFHHVALLFDGHIFDFFNLNESKKLSGHIYLDYIYENFFDFRRMLKSHLSNLRPDNYHFHKGFDSINLIEPYRKVSIHNKIISAKDYLSCIDGETVLFNNIVNSPSYLTKIESYDKKAFLLWYKNQFNQVIDETDTLLLWDNLYQLHWEGIKDNNWAFDNVAEKITNSFEWPQLSQMQKRWENSELTAYKYYDIIHLRN
jgi:hypothetical protein